MYIPQNLTILLLDLSRLKMPDKHAHIHTRTCTDVHCRIVREGKTGNSLNVYQQENGKTNSCNKSALK